MHLQPVHFERLNYEQIAFFEWVNLELTIQGGLIATLQEAVEKLCKKEPNIRDNPGGEAQVLDPTVFELIGELRQANQQREKLRQHLAAVIDATRMLLSTIDAEPGHRAYITMGPDDFVKLLVRLNNALFTAQQLLR